MLWASLVPSVSITVGTALVAERGWEQRMLQRMLRQHCEGHWGHGDEEASCLLSSSVL